MSSTFTCVIIVHVVALAVSIPLLILILRLPPLLLLLLLRRLLRRLLLPASPAGQALAIEQADVCPCW
jgi:hypothetical protein